MLTSLPLGAPRRRVFSLLVSTSLLLGLLLVSAPGVDAGRGGCRVTNETTQKTYASLTRAIKTAAPDDTLLIIETCIGSFTIDKNLSINPVDTGSAFIQGNGRQRVFWVNPGVTLDLNPAAIGSLYVAGGNAVESSGGGIYNDGGTVKLNGYTYVQNNTADEYGGGIYNVNGGTVELHGDATVQGNTSAFGGGGIANILGPASTVELYDNSKVHDNTTAGDGGGIFILSAIVNLYDSSAVSGNTAVSGGGIYSSFGTLVGCTAGGNVSSNNPDDIVAESL